MTTQDRTPDSVTDAQLSAWIDGALDEEGSAGMARLVATNEDLARRAARLRRMDELLRAAVPEEEDVPAELLARLGLAGAGASASTDGAAGPSAQVIDLAAARAARGALAAARPARRFAGFGRIAAQVLLVCGLGAGAMLAVNSRHPAAEPDAAYRALGDAGAPAAAANAIVRFEPGVGRARATALVGASGARLVGDFAPSGTARLAIDPARRDAVLARLRAAPGVVLAEPLDGTAP